MKLIFLFHDKFVQERTLLRYALFLMTTSKGDYMFEKLFKLRENHISVKREVIAGITTFLSAGYILAVIPNILSQAGMNRTSVVVTTAIVSALCSFAMGFFANYPITLGPGIGTAALFAFTVVPQLGSWQAGLAAVFLSGILFFIISLTGLRKIIIDAIPEPLKYAIGIGIGFFIMFIGLKNSNIIVADPNNFVKLGDFTKPTVLLALIGILITIALLARGVPLAIFWGMMATIIIGLCMGAMGFSGMPSFPSHFGVDFRLDEMGGFIQGLPDLFHSIPNLILVLFSFLFIDFFDTTGTLLTVNQRLKVANPNLGEENMHKALLVDSAANIFGSTMGVSSMATLIESTSGIEVGGRTGLTSIVSGLLFGLSLYIAPFINSLVTPAVTAPALVAVGILMSQDLIRIQWDHILYAACCLLTILTMVLSFSISNGIAIGFITYSFVALVVGDGKKVHPMIWILDVIFILNFYLMNL